jgi:predicted nucleotidyltransferase
VLFTSTQQRVLAPLFLHADRQYAIRELIDLAKAGFGAVQRLVAKLVEAELVVAIPQHKRRLYQANHASPIFHELHDLFVKTFGIGDPLRDALHRLGDRIAFAAIYGSIAKGTERAGRDVDLLLVADDVALDQLFTLLEPVEKRGGRKIHPTMYTRAEYAQRLRDKNAFLTGVLAGDLMLLIGDSRATSEAR